jgi:hypothetical protein
MTDFKLWYTCFNSAVLTLHNVVSMHAQRCIDAVLRGELLCTLPLLRDCNNINHRRTCYDFRLADTDVVLQLRDIQCTLTITSNMNL